jgi:hypothetical protein
MSSRTDADKDRERERRVPVSRVQHGAKKTEMKIRLPRRAVRNTELRRQSIWFMRCKLVKRIIVVTTGKDQKKKNRVTKSGIH